jgi:hypothetical protein
MLPNKKGKYILYSLFLSYFLTYAVSPLSGNCPAITVPSNTGVIDNAAAAVNKVNIFFWDLVCSKLCRENSGTPAKADVKLLMRKARAILPDDITRKITAIEQDVSASSSELHDYRRSFSGIVLAHDNQKPITLFNHLYSGHSPPSA